MRPLALIALGSNLGDSGRLVAQAMLRLQALSTTPVLQSSLVRSAPVDCPPGSPDFVNAVAAITPFPGETPETLLAKLQEIEREFGRQQKTVHNEPRPLDLDLIAWGAETRNSPQLVLPHPRAHLRSFVMAPLAEIAPEFILPGQSETAARIASRLSA